MSPSILPALPYTPATIAAAAELLRQGQLVIVPTETVYGIAFSLRSPEARSRVRILKNLSTPHWVPHLARAEDAQRLLPALSAKANRILHRAWPGPIAFQIPLTADEAAALAANLQDAASELLSPATASVPPAYASLPSITLRCPDHPTTLDILAAADFPIAIIGAGDPEEPVPPYELADIPSAIRDRVDALVEGGPTRHRKPSTLARLERFPVEALSVLRPGVIDERIILRMADTLILFVCSGNTCRSPMAAGLAQSLLAQKLGTTAADLPNRHILIQSAGLHAGRGFRATPEAVEALQERALDLTAHLSQPASLDLLRRADVIYTMTDDHREQILDVLPSAAAKTSRLDPEGDIPDPFGADLDVYRDVATRLEQIIRQRLDELVL